ncbi:MAG: hypothetical protein OEV99_10750 [Nitrospira sp.]|nr:hypothetical protein [Nitrospira sp.]MDH4370314.1 hypothetical protein [Nitrospira sp.]MDH5497514.1 hypothetical protein [Nitrospira sp.]MDH5726456.1 hypothetical protein [Nitrospira sp.]
MKCGIALLSALLLVGVFVAWPAVGWPEPAFEHHEASLTTDTTHSSHGTQDRHGWEGSPEGKDFSEFNHHFAGLCDVVFGLAELGYALQYPLPLWTRLVLPGTLAVIGAYMLVWSDHDAWPIGSLGFYETFFGPDREIVEHKFYGVLAAVIALCEALRRLGWVRHPAWAAPLILFVLVGSLLLFFHSHGNHPGSERIEFHHALLGSVGVGAALSKGLASWLPRASPHMVRRWEVAWAGSVILFGLLLLIYSE